MAYCKYFQPCGSTPEEKTKERARFCDEVLAAYEANPSSFEGKKKDQLILAQAMHGTGKEKDEASSSAEIALSIFILSVCTFVTFMYFHLIIFLTSYISVDLFIGFLHAFLDCNVLISHDLYGNSAFKFQIHHMFPYHYGVSSKWWEKLPEILNINIIQFVVAAAFGVLSHTHLSLPSKGLAWYVFYCTCAQNFFGFVGLLSHYCAHVRPENLPRFIKYFQGILLLDMESHKLHHCYFDQCFSLLNGMTNPVTQYVNDISQSIKWKEFVFLLMLLCAAPLTATMIYCPFALPQASIIAIASTSFLQRFTNI